MENYRQNNLTYGMLCCLCGASIDPNPTSMCLACLKTQVNITEGIDSEQSITFCRQCGRYNVGNDRFVAAEPESPQLLGICLKKIRGIKDARVVDAGFIWTEPHSRRIKVRLVLQKEVMHGAVLQQEHVCTFMAQSTMCEACQYSFTDHTWKACVQVRQRVRHKRTFLVLEQVLVRNRERLNITNTKEQPGGIDFFFNNKTDSNRFLDVLHATVPGTHATSEKLISADLKNNTAMIKYSVIFTIVPVCKDDLVCLPPRYARALGGLGPLCLVSAVNSRLHLIDPLTGKAGSLTAAQYFACPFQPILDKLHRVELLVLDTHPLDGGLCDVECQREQDTHSGETIFTRTHLGRFCAPGWSVAGYDLTAVDFQAHGVSVAPTVDVLVCGRWTERRNRVHKQRLQRFATEEGLPIVTAPDEELNELLDELDEQGDLATELDALCSTLQTLSLAPAPAATSAAAPGGSAGADAGAGAGAGVQAPAAGLAHMTQGGLQGVSYQGFCPQ